jgi:hypothetical protein
LGGDWRKVPFEDHLSHSSKMAAKLGFGFRRLDDKHLGRFIRFFCSLLGMTSGRFLSMISSAAHPTRPLRQPSWIWLRRLSDERWSIGPIFGALLGSSIFTMFHFSLNLIFHTPTDNIPLGGAYATPCDALVLVETYPVFKP